MRYNKIRKMDISNGPGVRVSVFFQGCAFHCKNCFNTETKASLYNIRYRIYEHYLDGNEEHQKKYNKLKDGVLAELLNCEMVSKVIPRIEADFCKESLDHMYTIISLITWIVLASLGVAIGSRRLQVLIWKKKKEIESMMANQEVLY